MFILCFANFELKQSDPVGRMTAQPHNRFFVLWSRSLLQMETRLCKLSIQRQMMVLTDTFYFMLCQSSLLSTAVSCVHKDKWWFDESLSVIFCIESI